MIEATITEALQKGVTAAIAACSDPSIPVKYIGRTLKPVPEKFVEVVQIVNNMENEYWGESRVYRGTLRLILHWPVNDEGAYPATRLRDSIAGHFTKEDRLWKGAVAVQIFDHPNAGSVIERGSELLFPVSIPYRSFER